MRKKTNDMAYFAVTIIGKDRPGIVAGAAEVLFLLGCNIQDSTCTMLGGEFAMILIVSHEKPFSKAQLLDDFKPLAQRMNLSVFARSLAGDEVSYSAPAGEICMVSVYGSDRPGIVFRVAGELAAMNINISDLNTKLIGQSDQPVYVMMLEAALPQGVEVETVTGVLEKLKNELNVEISVRPVTQVSL